MNSSERSLSLVLEPDTPGTPAVTLFPESSNLAPKAMDTPKPSLPQAPHNPSSQRPQPAEYLVPPTVYLAFDNIELLKESELHLLETLMDLQKVSGMPGVGLLFISSVGWDVFRSGTGVREPLTLQFPDYSDEQLAEILTLRHQQNPMYKPFLRSVVPALSRACRPLSELASSVEPLFALYYEPVRRGKVARPESNEGRRVLYALLKDHLAAAMQDPMAVHFGSGRGSEKSPEWSLEGGLPRCARYLLLAAYIASRNLATLDSSVFDFGDGRGGKRPRRNSGSAAQEKRERAIHEAQMRGPGTFPLERLLAIYSAIVESHEDDSPPHEIQPSAANTWPLSAVRSPSGGSRGVRRSDGPTLQSPDRKRRTQPPRGPTNEDAPGGNLGAGSRTRTRKGDVSAEVLLQLETLVKAGLVARSRHEPLEGAARFWCRLDEESIRKIAGTMAFPLGNYLLYG